WPSRSTPSSASGIDTPSLGLLRLEVEVWVHFVLCIAWSWVVACAPLRSAIGDGARFRYSAARQRLRLRRRGPVRSRFQTTAPRARKLTTRGRPALNFGLWGGLNTTLREIELAPPAAGARRSAPSAAAEGNSTPADGSRIRTSDLSRASGTYVRDTVVSSTYGLRLTLPRRPSR